MKKILGITFFILASSCAELASIDKSNLNHAAMNLEQRQTGELSATCTLLNGSNNSSQAGCATCAK